MRRTAIKERLALSGVPLGVLLGLPLGLPLSGCVAEYRATVETETDAETESADTEGDGTDTVVTPPADCAEDYVLCDGECIDPRWDSNHCGDCDEACLLDTMCVDGECIRPCGPECDPATSVCDDGACRCRPELVNCNGICANLFGDPSHCGACWDECPEDLPVCGDFECHGDCQEFVDACEETCTDFAFDPFNCGSCGHICDEGEICADGECAPYFPLDPVQCEDCPCPEACDMLCCWSIVLDTNVCVDGLLCPPE
ncbi:MAG: hypothetical protein AAGF11_05600 [Myxococcota bacterium]